MARKSQWQQFAENFKTFYDIGNDIQEGIGVKKIMDDEKFTAAGGLGYNTETSSALEGNALEKARYKALGDIYTKYGNVEQGLSARTSLADLESKERQNRMDENNFSITENIQGLLAQQSLQNNNNLTKAQANRLNQMTPVEILQMKENIAASQADTERNDSTSTQDILNSENVITNRNAKTKIEEKLADANVGEITARTTGLKQGNDVQKTSIAATQALDGIVTNFYKTAGNFDTPELAEAALIKTLNDTEMPAELRMSAVNAVQTHGIEKLTKRATSLGLQADKKLSQGLEQLVKWWDTQDDGEASSLDYREPTGDGGVFALYKTSGSGDTATSTLLFEGANRGEIEAKLLSSIKSPGNAFATIANILDNEIKKSSVKKTDSDTEFNAARVKNLATGSKLNTKQAELVAQQTLQVIQDMDQSLGLSVRERTKSEMKGLQDFVAEQLIYDPDLGSEDLKERVKLYLENSSGSSITITPID
jgi:hypothetical protein